MDTSKNYKCCSTSAVDEELKAPEASVQEFEQLLKEIELSVDDCKPLLKEVERTLEGDLKEMHISKEVQEKKLRLEDWMMNHAKISKDVLSNSGSKHWLCAGLTLIAIVLDITLKMNENKEQCIDIVSESLEIWKRIMKPLWETKDEAASEFVQESICIIIDAYIFICVQSHEEDLRKWRKKVDLLWSKAAAVLAVDIRDKLVVPPPAVYITSATIAVGLEKLKSDVIKMLDLGNKKDIRVVVLHGMGGVGKSTLGDTVYRQVSIEGQIRCRCRLELGEKPTREHITDLQKQMVENLTRESLLMERDPEAVVDKARQLLLDEKRDPILIYIDNVLQQEDLESFLPLGCERINLPKGSRWLITTRDVSVCTKVFGRNPHFEVHPCRVKIMNDKDAQKLFFLHAFGLEDPSSELVETFNDSQGLISKMVTSICGNLPLALTVLGKSLFKKDVSTWRKMYNDNYENVDLESKVRSVLRSSYNTLNKETQIAFLMICTCFFASPYSHANDVMESILGPRASTIRLFELGLLTWDQNVEIVDDNRMKVHDLVRAFGYEEAVVRKYAPTKMPTCKQDLEDYNESWSTIKWLRVPPFEGGLDAGFVEQCGELEAVYLDTNVNGHIENPPQQLKAVFITPGSRCSFQLQKLKRLCYFSAPNQTKNLLVTASTRSLQVWRGYRGRSISKEAIDLHKNTLRKLTCKRLDELPPYFCEQMSKLQSLVIDDFKGDRIPEEMGSLTSLEALHFESHTIHNLPRSLNKLTSLQTLCLALKDVEEIPNGVLGTMKELQYLDLRLERVTSLPMQDISQLSSLEVLLLNIPCVKSLITDQLPTQPQSLKLEKLKYFALECDSMCSLEGVQLSLYPSLEYLLLRAKKVQALPPDFITDLSKLQLLLLEGCDLLEELPSELMGNLLCLQYLVLVDCKTLKAIPEGSLLKSLKSLVVMECPGVQSKLPVDHVQQKAAGSMNLQLACDKAGLLPPTLLSLPNVVPIEGDYDLHDIENFNLLMSEISPSSLTAKHASRF